MKNLVKKESISMLLWIIGIILITFFITRYVRQRAVVQGHSMESTLQDKDSLLLDKVTYRFSDPKRYDIVIFPGRINENGQKEMFVKRIIGLPGERVEIKDGSVYINGEKLEDDIYAKDGYTDQVGDYCDLTLMEGEYYCLGDNRGNSEDSRYLGPVMLDKSFFGSPGLNYIVGKVQMRIYPFDKITKY